MRTFPLSNVPLSDPYIPNCYWLQGRAAQPLSQNYFSVCGSQPHREQQLDQRCWLLGLRESRSWDNRFKSKIQNVCLMVCVVLISRSNFLTGTLQYSHEDGNSSTDLTVTKTVSTSLSLSFLQVFMTEWFFFKEKCLIISALFNIIQCFPIGLRKMTWIMNLVWKAPRSQTSSVTVRPGFVVLQ